MIVLFAIRSVFYYFSFCIARLIVILQIDSALYDALQFIRDCSREDFEGSVFEKFTTQLSDKTRV